MSYKIAMLPHSLTLPRPVLYLYHIDKYLSSVRVRFSAAFKIRHANAFERCRIFCE